MKQKKYLIYGLAKSGESAFNLIYNKRDLFYLFDDNEQQRKSFDLKINTKPNVFVLKEIDKTILNKIDELIISPAISIYNDFVLYTKQQNKSVISELELGFRYCKNKIIAITGTNGKTTTVNLLYDILKLANKKVEKVGNIGIPLSSVVKNVKRKTILICEVSSFQLEGVKTFKPFMAGILNITPDHIDRHKNFLTYKKEKFKIFKNLNKKNKVVINSNLKIKNDCKIYKFSTKKVKKGCFIKNKKIYFASSKKVEKICSILDLPEQMQNKHNLENILSCICFAKLLKIKNQYIKQAIQNFKLLPHRIQKVYEIENKTFYDDSKATNIDATIKAIESFKNKEIILILGGSDKGYEYSQIFENLTKSVVKVISCGEVATKIYNTGKNFNIEVEKFLNLKEATIFACKTVKPNQIVLLSPASASFDEFNGYKERGEKFLTYIKDYYEQT